MQPGDVVICSERIPIVFSVEQGEVGIVQDCDEYRGYANVLFVGRLLLHMLPISHLQVLEPADYQKGMAYYVSR